MININYSKNCALHWNSKTKTFSGELSDLRINPELQIKVTVIESGNNKIFTQVGVDKDGSGEDIYGYRYKSLDGFNLLLIND
jgi:hypothetical protein